MLNTMSRDMSRRNRRVRGAISLKVIPFLESYSNWDTEMRESEEDTKFYFSLSKTQPGAGDKGRADGRSGQLVAERFLEIKDGEQALKFFREFGPMQLAHQFDGTKTQKPTADPVSLSQVRGWQERFFHGVSGTATSKQHRKLLNNWYLTQPLKIELTYSPLFVGTAPCKDVEECLRASVFLDSLRGFTWYRCARKECGKLFSRTTQKMIFCSQKCAHVQAQTAYRKRFVIKSAELGKKGRHGSVSEPARESKKVTRGV